MARFRCRACGQQGTFEYDGRHACPRCGSQDVQFALGSREWAICEDCLWWTPGHLGSEEV